QGIAAAEAIEDQGELYIAAGFSVFEDALHHARVTAADPTSSQMDVNESLRVLEAAQGQLEWIVHELRIEAEGFSSSNGGGLKAELTTDDTGSQIGNVGGTWDGGVLTYDNVDLSAGEFSTVSV